MQILMILRVFTASLEIIIITYRRKSRSKNISRINFKSDFFLKLKSLFIKISLLFSIHMNIIILLQFKVLAKRILRKYVIICIDYKCLIYTRTDKIRARGKHNARTAAIKPVIRKQFISMF